MRLVCDTLKYREQNNIVRNDFLHIMAQLKKTCKEYDFTNEDVTAHAAGFFGDGYETSSIVMSFTLFELAANPECQSRLREELEASFENDKISYEALTSLAYLEAAICGKFLVILNGEMYLGFRGVEVTSSALLLAKEVYQGL